LKKKQLILALVGLALLVALLVYAQHKYPFNWRTLADQVRQADWRKIGIATGCIYLGYVFRSVRWALFVRHNKKVPPFALLGTQVIGFTAVALIGRVADPVRPYLVSRKTGLPLSSQIAVYVVERMFDLGAMALLFSAVLLTTHEALPHPELLQRVAKGGLLATIALAAFTVSVRLAGGMVAAFMQRSLSVFSKKLGQSVGDKIRTFRIGLDTMRTFMDFGAATALSLAMWMVITLAYLETTQAFVASPQLASMTLPRCMVLMASSMVASGFQLPVIGWFTQIGLVAAAMTSFFSVAPEPAAACAATLLLVTFLSIIPVGLIWSRFEHVSLRKITAESGQAGELPTDEPAEIPPV
jgi:glycosyltransferase 2 family protein